MNNNNTLKQRGLLSGERRFELKDGRYLFVDVKQLKRNKSYQLDLVALEPNSKFSFRINWPWLMAAVVVMLVHYFLLQLLPRFFQISLDDYALPLTLGLASLFLHELFQMRKEGACLGGQVAAHRRDRPEI